MNRMEYEIEEIERNRNYELKHQDMEEYHKHQKQIIDPDEVLYRIEHCSHINNNTNINANANTRT